MENLPRISVIIPTRNRPDDMKRVLDSVAKIEYPDWELLVVDQSDDAQTRELVKTLQAELPNVRYRALSTKGSSFGRNVGIQETDADLMAFLDDDCTVNPDWLIQAAAAFARHPRAGLMYGDLRPAKGLEEWSDEGWTPVRLFPTEFETNVITHPRERFRIWSDLMGNGACMFMRRSIVPRVGFFDTELGGGSDFHSAEDGDFTYRALMAGCNFVGTPAIVAEHHGLREYENGAASDLIRDYEYGIGGFLMKELRLGDPFAVVWIVREYRRLLGFIRLRNIITRQGGTGLAPGIMFTRGLLDSFRLRVDRKHKLYVRRVQHQLQTRTTS